ncbi:MAG: DUF4097 family beta strand repeat protein [Bacteroidetes bacterium]|nr:DUF4097 family beta strand repeat protein [Bacteroidota bacterium]
MKNYKKQTMLVLLMLIFSAYIAAGQDLKKSYSESFDVKADAEVVISNKYGKVHIDTWDKNQVVIDVLISVDAKSEKESQRILDKITIEISGSNAQVEANTQISGNLNCRNYSLNIDYEVKMPESNMLYLENQFGSTVVGDLSGKARIQISYGDLTLGDLNSKENIINVRFGDTEIDFLKAADLHIEYGSLELGKSGYLDLYSRFSSVEIGEVSEFILDSEYDGFEIGSVDGMRAKASFTDIEIGELFDKIDLTSSYGGIEIDRVSGGFSSVDIRSEFGGVELGISSSASYKFHAQASFGDIDFPESGAEITKQIEKSFSKEVEAFIGDDKSSSSTVIISAKNCDIEIH